MSTVSSIDASQAKTMKDEGAIFIDVREPAEFNGSHIPDAHLLPLGKITANSSPP